MGILNLFKKNGNIGISLQILSSFPLSKANELVISLHKILKSYYKGVLTEYLTDTKTKKLLTCLNFYCYNPYYSGTFQDNPKVVGEITKNIIILFSNKKVRYDLNWFKPEMADIERLEKESDNFKS